MNNFSNNKYKRPRRKTIATTNPGTSRPRNGRLIDVKMTPEPLCPLLAKDSEWVEMQMQPSAESSLSASNVSDEEEVLQLVECEDGPQMKPLAIMFPDLIEKDPLTLQGVLNRVMSTTEVTRHLVELGQKANFTFMKKADRLIPRDKQWMESLTENSNSYCSINSALVSNSILSSNEVNREITSNVQINTVKKKKKRSGNTNRSQQESSSRDLKEK